MEIEIEKETTQNVIQDAGMEKITDSYADIAMDVITPKRDVITPKRLLRSRKTNEFRSAGKENQFSFIENIFEET
jgi:homoserine dehydrogenase